MGESEAGIEFQVFFREGCAFVDRHFSLEMDSRRMVVSSATRSHTVYITSLGD